METQFLQGTIFQREKKRDGTMILSFRVAAEREGFEPWRHKTFRGESECLVCERKRMRDKISVRIRGFGCSDYASLYLDRSRTSIRGS
jgi:hypothetical protein